MKLNLLKGSLFIFTLLVIAGIFTSCEKSDIEYENNFDKSYKSWMSFKEASNNSYRYLTSTHSWTGIRTETIITVKEGKVVGRSYVAVKYSNDGTNDNGLLEEWTEDEDNLNSHPNGAATMTLDEIYQKARTDWLLERENATTYFETNNNGMISSAGYVDRNCADDCFVGIRIEYIEAL